MLATISEVKVWNWSRRHHRFIEGLVPLDQSDQVGIMVFVTFEYNRFDVSADCEEIIQ